MHRAASLTLTTKAVALTAKRKLLEKVKTKITINGSNLKTTKKAY